MKYWEIHRTNGEVVTSGQKRSYRLYVPKNYQAGKPTPLVISIHGYAEWPAHQMELSQRCALCGLRAKCRSGVLYHRRRRSFLAWRRAGAKIYCGHTTQDVDATRLLWEFFKQHPLEK